MQIVERARIRSLLVYSELIDLMREALIAQAQGLCATPLPMHLDIPEERGEVHVKASQRRGGSSFALKIATTFPRNLARGISTGNGLSLLVSAQTGEPQALLADGGHLTDVRTAAVAALAARELGRQDAVLGILGSGIQARLQAQMHAHVLPLKSVWIWGRTPERAAECVEDLKRLMPGVALEQAATPAAVARQARLLVTTTASRAPLLAPEQVLPGTHISAVGSDGPGKQELDPRILQAAALLLVDSKAQCERLGELQHALSERERAVELGAFCQTPPPFDTGGCTVCDFTGLGVEDLYIAEYCRAKLAAQDDPAQG